MADANRAGEGGSDATAGRDGAPVAAVPVSVRFERSVSGDRWAVEQWRVASVDPADEGSDLGIALHRDEAEGCWLNLTTDDPSIFVMWRPDEGGGAPRAVAVTVSYAQAARWLDGGEQVDRVPMPDAMRPWVAEFVDLHYRPEQGRRKRRGNKPSFMRGDELEAMARAERERFGGGGGERS
jgi:hypothetical protein